MRSSKSRSRNKSNRQRSLGNIVNRVFDSSGPEGKVRGTPQQIIDKYHTLARDAQLSNDRVAEQSFLQHAEHYTRMLGEAQREMAERQAQHQQNQQNHHHQRHHQNGDDRDGSREQNRENALPEAVQRGGGDQSRAEPIVAPTPAPAAAEPVKPVEEKPVRRARRPAAAKPAAEAAPATETPAPAEQIEMGLPETKSADDAPAEAEKKPARKTTRAKTPRAPRTPRAAGTAAPRTRRKPAKSEEAPTDNNTGGDAESA